jgi:hypothetical protein
VRTGAPQGSPHPPTPPLKAWALRDPSGMSNLSMACSENGIGTRRVAKAAGGEGERTYQRITSGPPM